jgi:Uma2 family endonuclease
MSSLHLSLLTPAEYLAIERKSEIRSEYIGGRMYAMSGAGSWHSLNAGNGRRHSLIAGNVFGAMWSQIRGKGCEAHMNDMRVKVSPTGLYTYPDIVAVCGEARFEDAEIDTLLNPTVIVEVLSPSTEAYDRGEKFANYRRVDTLREYVLVAQDKIRIEHYRCEGEQWILSEVGGPEATLHLGSIDCHIQVSAIYEKIEFETMDDAAGALLRRTGQ